MGQVDMTNVDKVRLVSIAYSGIEDGWRRALGITGTRV